MPIYEYQCRPCGAPPVEDFRNLSERDKEKLCPDCGEPMVRVITNANLPRPPERYMDPGPGRPPSWV